MSTRFTVEIGGKKFRKILQAKNPETVSKALRPQAQAGLRWGRPQVDININVARARIDDRA